MKKSYKKILLFELIILAILILNSFESSILKLYNMPLFLLVLDVIFYFILGYEKDNKRLKKEMMFEVFFGITSFLLVYYLFGILIGFSRINNYFTLYGISTFIIPLILTILFKEHLRNSILTKTDSKLLIILTTIVFIMIDLSSTLDTLFIKSSYEVFSYVALVILPSISTNIFLTYITKKISYIPGIIYLLIINLYKYIIPIVPNPNEYLKSIIDMLLPIGFLLRTVYMDRKYTEDYEITSRNNKKRLGGIIIPVILIICIVYLISGYFKYYAVAVASGSMNPVFDRGAIVIVEQTNEKNNNYNKISEGDIIAFKKDNVIIVHRVIKIIEINDEKYYYTKGDANNNEDDWQLSKESIIGIVRVKIPYIGYPTVWFSEL